MTAMFIERMRRVGAVAVRIGSVAVSFTPPSFVPGTSPIEKKKKPTEEDVLFHSS